MDLISINYESTGVQLASGRTAIVSHKILATFQVNPELLTTVIISPAIRDQIIDLIRMDAGRILSLNSILHHEKNP